MTRPQAAGGRWFGPVEPSGPRGTAVDPVDRDSGRAIVEVVFLAVLMLIPVIYILIGLLRVQSATFAVTQAARDAGRAIDAAPTIADGIDRAQQIAAVDLADQHIGAGGLTVFYAAAGSSCDGDVTVSPSLDPGASYDVCVTATLTLPGVPTAVTGSRNTVTGVYTVTISRLREGP